jgi:hypothetical protein
MVEDPLRLPLVGVGEFNPDVQTSRSSQRWIKTLDVIGRDDNKPIGSDKGDFFTKRRPRWEKRRTGLPQSLPETNWSRGHSGLKWNRHFLRLLPRWPQLGCR